MTNPETPDHAPTCPVPCCGPTGDPVVPEQAVEPVAKAIYEAPHDGLSRNGYDAAPRDIQDLYRLEARLAIAAALPHLRVQETPAAKCHRCGYALASDDTYTRLDGTTYHLRNCPSTVDEANAATPHPRPVVDREALIADRTGENALAEWLEEVFSTDEDTTTWEMAAKALFDLGAVCDPAPLPTKADVIAAVRKVVYAEFGTFDGPVDRIATAILALLPTEEGGHSVEETKRLTKFCYERGRLAGRREALIEAAKTIEAKLGITSRALGVLRNLASQPTQAASKPLATPTGQSDLPEAPAFDLAALKAEMGESMTTQSCPEYYPVAITRMMCVKEAGHEDEHQTAGGVTWRNRYLTKGASEQRPMSRVP